MKRCIGFYLFASSDTPKTKNNWKCGVRLTDPHTSKEFILSMEAHLTSVWMESFHISCFSNQTFPDFYPRDLLLERTLDL